MFIVAFGSNPTEYIYPTQIEGTEAHRERINKKKRRIINYLLGKSLSFANINRGVGVGWHRIMEKNNGHHAHNTLTDEVVVAVVDSDRCTQVKLRLKMQIKYALFSLNL